MALHQTSDVAKEIGVAKAVEFWWHVGYVDVDHWAISQCSQRCNVSHTPRRDCIDVGLHPGVTWLEDLEVLNLMQCFESTTYLEGLALVLPASFRALPSISKKMDQKTRWSPRTRMPTRMLRNRDNTHFSHFPANPLVRHPELTRWGDTLVGHPCLTLLRNALVRHSCLTLLFDTLVWHSCKTLLLDTLTWHSYLTLLTWHFLLDTLTWHSCLTLLTWHSYLTFSLATPLLRDTLVRQSYLTLPTWHSDLTFL